MKKEGVVEVKEGSRVIDVIESAGGTTDKADLSKVNLAYAVNDGQKIYIPSINNDTDIPIVSTGITEDDKSIGTFPLNINTATQTELEQLPGVGPSIANSIITYRKENGKFSNIEELKKVPGIGNSKYNNIKDNVCI